jgi:hypothetical protein
VPPVRGLGDTVATTASLRLSFGSAGAAGGNYVGKIGAHTTHQPTQATAERSVVGPTRDAVFGGDRCQGEACARVEGVSRGASPAGDEYLRAFGVLSTPQAAGTHGLASTPAMSCRPPRDGSPASPGLLFLPRSPSRAICGVSGCEPQ